MAQTIKRPFKTFNGKDWDTHYFATSEDMLTGILQDISAKNGYRKLPGGLIIQWGEQYFPLTNGFEAGRINFPLAFPNDCFIVVPVIHANGHDQWKFDKPLVVRYDSIEDKKKHFNWSINIDTQNTSGDTSMYVSWIAIGK